MSKSKPTVLFSELPLHAKFKYVNGQNIYIKTGDGQMHRDGARYFIAPGTLVEPVKELELLIEVVPPEVGVDSRKQAKVINWDEEA